MWIRNPETGLVDIDGTFACTRQNLTDFKGVEFGEVTGDFWCQENQLTSLEGVPKKIGGDLYCEGNQVSGPMLKSLYRKIKSGMSWEKAVEMQWDYMDEEDRIPLAQYNARLTPEEIIEYQALARLKKRVL